MNFTIRLDYAGISIDETVYKWDDIYDTAFLCKKGGPRDNQHLVIALKNMSTYETYDLANFVGVGIFGFGGQLAKYIQYFKTPH